ncbi:MAG: tRNA guanosine(34) transglycosylase Tgt [bacterium]
MGFFKTLHSSAVSKARLGEIHTDHGVVKTPAFMPAGTKGTIKGLTQGQIKDLKIQISFVNTYHLVTHPGVEVLQKAGGIHTFAKYNIPLMSDSGGFQVFSLANQNKRRASIRGEEQPLVEKISEDGVVFRSVYDGQLITFTPETSMDFQRIIGADINMAFDECTYYPATHEYAEKAMKRTHLWLERCIKHRAVDSVSALLPASAPSLNESPRVTGSPSVRDTSRTCRQYLYGIIQGGTFEDLRKKSAEFVVTKNTPGVAIGGVSVGESKKEMRNQVEWVAPYLPKDRPVHLLGVGQVDDIVDLVKYGIDTFDCVEPTRVARMGTAYQTRAVLAHLEGTYAPYEIDINKAAYKTDLSSLDEECGCSTCVNYSKAYLHHLFKQRELLGYTLLSYHNLYVMERLMELIRKQIEMNLL